MVQGSVVRSRAHRVDGLAPRLALLAPAWLLGCGGGAREELPPNVLLIVLDTLRADHVSCYGAPRPTPSLDALAAEGTRYEHVSSSAPWTVPSHASLFTGRDPHTHGAHSFWVDEFTGVDNVYGLVQGETTLAEVLAEEGYDTGGVVANAMYLKPAFGLSQGFAHWSVSRVRAPRLNQEALEWIDARPAGRPWFLFLNYMDAHRPYNVEALPGEEEIPPRESSALLLDALYERVMIAGEEPGELAGRIREQYARAVRNLDLALGELFTGLRARGLWDDLVLVVTSDHGEYFGEHGLVEHSKDVYQEALEVPLIVKEPRQAAGRTVGERASSAHVPHLVLQAIGGGVAARNVARFPARPGDPVLAENHYSRLKEITDPALADRFRRVRTAYFLDGWKLVRSSDGAHELYRLDEDPRELVDRAALEPELLAELLAELERRLARTPFDGGEREMVGGKAHLDDLRGSGYAGD